MMNSLLYCYLSENYVYCYRLMIKISCKGYIQYIIQNIYGMVTFM